MALNKQAIMSKQDVLYKTIQVKAWDNEDLIIKSMTARQTTDFMKNSQKKNSDQLDIMVEVVIMCCVDDNHNKIFDKQDAPALSNKQFDAILQIFNSVMDIAELSDGSVEEEAKN